MRRASRGPVLAAVAVIGLAFTACEYGPTEPQALQEAAVAQAGPALAMVAKGMRQNAAGFYVFPYQVRPAEGSESGMWGELQLWIGVPPNPIFPPNPIIGEGPVLVLRGVLHNPMEEALESADFVFRSGPDGEAFEMRVSFDAPPNPCATIRPRGAVSLPDPGPPGIAYPDPGPPNVSLTTGAGMLVALPNPGPPGLWYPSPGPPDNGYPDPGPPTTPGSCLVGVQIGR